MMAREMIRSLLSNPTREYFVARECLRRHVRLYVSRAHPRSLPEYGVLEALDQLLHNMQQRVQRRERKLQRNIERGTPKSYGHFDETVEIALNLNLDPRKPGQALRGNLTLPHGTGKQVNCLVFTSDEMLAQQAQAAGALHAGGQTLLDRVVSGEIALDSVQRSLATPEMQGPLGKQAARLLGPRGLMPNAKTGTLVEASELLPTLQQASSEVLYRTDRQGILHVAVGKASFGKLPLLENLGAVLTHVFRIKPETYGKGKKASKNAKYLLKVTLSSTQGPGIKLDVRTVDPASPFFLTAVEEDRKDQVEEASLVA